jgi:hypothetical protein
MLQVSNLDVAFFIDMFHVDLNVTHNINWMLQWVFFYQWMATFFHNFFMLQMLSFHVVDTFYYVANVWVPPPSGCLFFQTMIK